MKHDPYRGEKIQVTVHRDLRKNIRAINERLNANPEIARLVLVNPILALEDVGVEIAPEVKEHIMEALRFPPALEKRKGELEAHLHAEFARLGFKASLPLSVEQRAELLFGKLQLAPREPDDPRPSAVPSNRTRAYARHHPLAASLAEYERLRQGALVFQPREVYQAHKAGEKRQRWIKSVRFNI